MQKS
ncbi:Protein of unknown function [Lactobacillus helveticus CIRM-BIA 103]|jgi:hypothetical protein